MTNQLLHIGRKLARFHARLHRSGALNSEPVTLRWRTASAPPTGYLPDVESSAGSAVTFTDHSAVVTALVHYVNIHTTGYTRYAQIEHGDVILDFLGSVALDDKPALRFEVGGKIYVQKDGGDELASSWDVRCNGTPITRTVLASLLS